MKKVIILLIALLSIILVSGCTDNKTNDNGTTNTPVPAPAPMQHAPNMPAPTPTEIVHPTGQVYEIHINNSQFSTRAQTIKLGDAVRWINDDFTERRVVGTELDSGVLIQGANYTYMFTKSGAFNYVCDDDYVNGGVITVNT